MPIPTIWKMDDVVNVFGNETLLSRSMDPAFTWNTLAVLKAVLFGTITLGTSFGNLIVLLAVIFRRKTLRLSTHTLIANLAFADLLVGVLVMPILASYTITGTWYFGQTYCHIWTSIHFWICAASILSITSICLDRYIGVQYPLQHYKKMNSKKVTIISIIVWTLAGCLSIIPLFVWPEPSLSTDSVYQCKINFQLGHVIVVSIFIFYIPLGIMLILYWKIYRVAMDHFQRIREGCINSSSANTENMRIHVGKGASNSNSSNLSTNSTSGSGSYGSKGENESGKVSSGTSSSSSGESKGSEIIGDTDKDLLAVNYQRESKTAKKVSIIVGAFILSYFPFFTAFTIKSLSQELITVELLIMMAWIRYFNSFLNPIIYAVMLKPFRKAFQYMFEKFVTAVTCKN